MNTSRSLCLTALNRMQKDGAYSNIVLGALLDKSDLSNEEKSFASRLFYGVLEKKSILDYNIKPLSKRPVERLDSDILNILRMGMYQLLYMDSVPDNAAVNECVKLCTFTKKKSASGFVNALLRSKIREGKALLVPKKLNERLCISESIADIFCEQYGEEKTESIFSAFEKRTSQYIRVNTNKISVDDFIALLENENIKAQKVEKIQGVLICDKITVQSKLFREGLFYFQDLSSQSCCTALQVKGAQSVLDLCSAPGSKSFTLSLMADKDCKIVSCDISENRVSLIKKSVERLGLKNITPTVNDARIFKRELGLFDRVLCDVPCSGLGVIGKKPEIRYKNVDKNELFDLQFSILENGSKHLKDDGILVYSTCTLNKCENEEVVDRFLKEHKEFTYTDFGKKTFLPDEDNCNGFFVAAFKKK